MQKKEDDLNKYAYCTTSNIIIIMQIYAQYNLKFSEKKKF